LQRNPCLHFSHLKLLKEVPIFIVNMVGHHSHQNCLMLLVQQPSPYVYNFTTYFDSFFHDPTTILLFGIVSSKVN
jgi:hypothetical protein